MTEQTHEETVSEKKLKKRVSTLLAYKTVFSTPEGKLVLEDLIKSCHVDKPTFSENSHEMAFKEGERTVALRILRTIETDVDNYIKIIKGIYSGEVNV